MGQKRQVVHIISRAMAVALLFLTLILLISLGVVGKWNGARRNEDRESVILALNEIEKLTEIDGESPAKVQIHVLTERIAENRQSDRVVQIALFCMYAACIATLCFAFGYLYFVILKPFQKLENYAGELAQGNLDVQLLYERRNIFGAFTWAFDHMRMEIQKARQGEQEAITNYKTVITTLSHDIKTPIASIRTHAEALAANMDTSMARKERYMSVIIKKCDEVTELTNDLFLHALSDMDKLQITCEAADIMALLKEIVAEQTAPENVASNPVDLVLPENDQLQQLTVSVDSRRFKQAVGNLLSNAGKYAAGAAVHIWIENSLENEAYYEIHMKDEGHGVAPEDVPFLFEKFYRGKNTKNQAGAGLGLYIVKYMMQRMGGDAYLANYREHEGLEIVLKLPGKMKDS